ncbi:MAG: hypothetical protein ACKO6E_05095 [Planctomycetota bacterium]
MNYPPTVERRYGDGTYPGDHYAEQALKHAPAWVLRAVRDARERRGMRPLACTATARIGAAPRKSPPPTPAARSKSAPPCVLVGIAAPFVSRPCATGRDARQIGERFTATAWRSIIAAVQRRDGQALVLRTGHHGETVATSADGGIDPRSRGATPAYGDGCSSSRGAPCSMVHRSGTGRRSRRSCSPRAPGF